MNKESIETYFLAGYVALWDKYAEETLTHAFQRGLDNPKYRPLVLGAMAVTGLHLLRELPRPADPYYIIERTAKLFLPTP